jgi:hypothetical protein
VHNIFLGFILILFYSGMHSNLKLDKYKKNIIFLFLIILFLQEFFLSELLFFSEEDFVDLLVPPPSNTYVQTINGSITRHHLTYVCNIIYYIHSLLLCLGSSQLSSKIYKDLLSHIPLTRQARPQAL